MIVIGCDPGLQGALAFIDHHGELLALDDIPTMPNPDAGPKTLIKREIDVCALLELLRERVPPQEAALCAMEHVSVMGGKGSQAIVSLAATKASIMAVLRLARLTTRRITPQAWKRFYGLDSDKARCLNAARTLYPEASLARAKDHNRAEALLIARFALRNLT